MSNIKLRDDFDGHHGDVPFYRLNALPKGAKYIGKFKEFVAQEGETTGHKHVIASDVDFEVYKIKDRWLYLLTAPAEISHQEHGNRIIQPGILEQGQENEENPWTDEVVKVDD